MNGVARSSALRSFLGMARNLGFLVLMLSVIFVCEAVIFHPISESHRFAALELFTPLHAWIFWKVGRDPRPVMREAYNMFRDGGDPEKQVAAFSRGQESEYFYASLYVGLYYESQTLFLMGSCIYWKPFAANIVDCFYDLEETYDEFFYQNRDFGMMGEFKQELRDGFIEACLHLVNRDYDALAKDLVTVWLLPPTADKDAVTKAFTGVLKNAVAKGVHNISFGDLLGNLGTTMYKFKFQIPSYFSLVIRRIAHRLSMKCKISLVYSSDLKRPLDTAEAIASSCGDLEV
ncbi:hypothetical protein ACSBR1_040668 [Camellia fascicularis]